MYIFILELLYIFMLTFIEKKYPVLLDIRSTLLAVDREDCGSIMVEVAGGE